MSEVALTSEQSALLSRLRYVDRASEAFAGEPTSESGHVYFFQQGDDGPIKIGCSLNVARRFREVQTGCALPLRVLGVAPLAGFRMERRLHQMFATDRLMGEWFRPSEFLYDVASDYAGAIR